MILLSQESSWESQQKLNDHCKMPRVSVIIPIYNVERYLHECIESVLAQTLRDIEVICVDDGSTDGSLAVAQEFAAIDQRVRVVAGEHSDAGRCRNVGMGMAQGKWLSFLDADDVFAPQMLETLVCVAEKDDAEIAICRFSRFYDGDAGYLDSFTKSNVIESKSICMPAESVDVFARWVGWAWDKLFRRDFIQNNSLCFQAVPSSNDLRFVYSALSLCNKVVEVDANFVAHRMHNTSLQATRKKDPVNFLQVLRSYKSEMDKRGAFGSTGCLYSSFQRYVVSFSLFQLDYIGNLAAHNKIRTEAVRYWNEIGVDKCIGNLFAEDFRIRVRCKIVIGCPLVEMLYYAFFKSIVCNPSFRRMLKRICHCVRRGT